MKRFYWDFFGPRAEGTAQHFLTHLREFLAKNGFPEQPSGLMSNGPGHHAVYCAPGEEYRESIVRSLRPRRSTEE